MAQKITAFIVYAVIFGVLWVGLWVWQNRSYRRYEGDEMAMTLPKDDQFWANTPNGTVREVQLGSIVMYDYHKQGWDRQTRWMGRVIGLPGQKVKIVNGEVFVDGRRISDAYVASNLRTKESLDEIVVPTDCIYVLHDNRRSSSFSEFYGYNDSRVVGPIGINALVGLK